MIVYIVLFFAILLVSFFFDNSEEKVPYPIFLGICLLIGLFVGLGDMLGGYDRYIYAEVFDTYSDEVHAGKGMLNSLWPVFFGIEPAYGLINYIIALFTSNRYIFILIITILSYFLFATSIYRYSQKPFFCLTIFMGLCFFFTFTYIRQILAMAILWNALPYIEKRKAIPFFGIVLFAALIHNAALYFAIVYFVPTKNYSKQFIIISMLVLLMIGIVSPFNMIIEAYGDMTSASRKADLYKQTSEYGFRFEYLLESAAFLAILLYNYDRIAFSKRTSMLVNLYLMFCGTLLLFIKSSDGGRMSWIFAIGIILLFAKIIDETESGGLRLLTTALSLTLYIRVLVLWGTLVSPYKTFLTDGYRDGDIIHSIYEYDRQYDIDKFYR